MKLFVFIILISLEYSTVKCELNSSVQSPNEELFLRTRPIQMNEELDADTQLVNLTELIYSLIVNKSSNIESNLRIDSVRFAADSEWTEYFKLDTKQISFSSASKLIKSIDLKTSSLKRIDRETICPVTQQKPCQITIKLIAQFDSKEVKIEVPININDSNDNKPAFYQSDIRIDIDLNKPMPPLVKIPLKLAYDLDSTYENRIQEYSLTHLNKNTTDLAGTNRVYIKYLKRQNKESLSLVLNSTDLDAHVSETEIFQLKAKDPNYDAFQTIEIKFIKQKLQHVFTLFEKNFFNLTLTTSNQISLNVLANSNGKAMASTCDTIKFNAYNPQLNNKIVLADFRLDKHVLSIAFVNTFKLNQVRLVARCGDLNDTAFVILNESPSANHSLFNLNLISAVNDLDINETLNNVYEFKFKTSDSTKGSISSISNSNINTANLNSSFVTLAYLIAEQQPQPFSQQQHQQPHHPDNSLTKFKLNKEMDESYHDLIRIDEMRNGLYAFKLSTKYLNLIKKLNSNEDDYEMNSVSYTIKLSLTVIDSDFNIGRTLKLRMPQLRLIQTTPNLSPPPLSHSALHVERADVSTQILTKKTLTISSTVTVTAATLISSFNLFNSVVLITAISVVLILIALGCFIVSLSLYLKSKCRQMKQIKQINKSGHLPEINLNLTDKKLLKMSGSSSIELGSAESGISSGQPSSSSSSSSSDLSCNSSTITTTTNNKQHFNLLKASNDFMPSNQQQQQHQPQKPSWVNQNAIMVYDVMPSQHLHTNPPNPSSSVSSSSSSNYQKSAMDSSNISPITTTSGVDSAVSASSSMKHHQALLQLSAKHLEATENIKWYMDANSSNSTDLIRPLPVKLQSSEKSDSSLNLNKEYRNEIYRNSHLIFKNAQYSQMKKNLPKKQADEPTEQSNFKTYEAKPISLNNKELYSTTTIGTTNSNINSSSSLDNYDTVNFDSMSSNSINLANGFSNREKMVNRLSTAISIVTNSSENSGSCLANKSLSKINSNNQSMADSEQVSSV